MTLAQLRARLRLTLVDATAWPDSTLDRWIAAGIQLYSAHFPRRLRSVLTLVTGTQAYRLPGSLDHRGLLSVEYPTGWVPARELRPLAEWAPGFGPGCYALRGVSETEQTAVGWLVFGDTVQTGEEAAVEYWGPHLTPDVGEDETELTLPAQHLEAITAYCEFAAHYELETDEALVTDGSTIMLAQLGEESRRAWNRYKEVMDRLTWLSGAGVSAPQPAWGRIGL